MKNKLASLILSSALLLPFTSSAQEYMFTYSKLHTHMKQNGNEGHDDVKVGFFFVNAANKELCRIEKTWMEKEEHYEELKVSKYNELLVPLDANLKQANPLVFVRTPEALRCDFSMVVMSKEPLQGTVKRETIENLLPQMHSILVELGGMFASWFTPDVEGLTLEFPVKQPGDIVFSNGKLVTVQNGKFQFTAEELGELGTITLPMETSRVLPYLPAAK
ncbi:DUF2987 domain-containing protein [Vibrio sp.]|nr:DUF2987 domain-containing protein [Vibrio sp.]